MIWACDAWIAGLIRVNSKFPNLQKVSYLPVLCRCFRVLVWRSWRYSASSWLGPSFRLEVHLTRLVIYVVQFMFTRPIFLRCQNPSTQSWTKLGWRAAPPSHLQALRCSRVLCCMLMKQSLPRWGSSEYDGQLLVDEVLRYKKCKWCVAQGPLSTTRGTNTAGTPLKSKAADHKKNLERFSQALRIRPRKSVSSIEGTRAIFIAAFQGQRI